MHHKTRKNDFGFPKKIDTCRSDRLGFSLIELLVAISIIALLIGIILPVLARSRSSAIQTLCMSRLQQAGTSWGSYMTDYQGKLPPAFALDNSYAPFFIPEEVASSLVSYGMTAEIGICPTLEDSWEENPNISPMEPHVNAGVSGNAFFESAAVGYSVVVNYDNLFVNIPPFYNTDVPSSASSSFDSGNKVLMADLTAFIGGSAAASAGYRVAHQFRKDENPDGGHTLFLDGHVKWFSAVQMGKLGDANGYGELTANFNSNQQPGFEQSYYWGVE